MNIIVSILTSLAGAVIFLLVYELILKKYFTYLIFKPLCGIYIVCSQDGDEFINSPEEIPNCLSINIKFINPNVLITYSKDYDRTYTNIWKTWSGEISMEINSKGHGSGYYIYDEGREPGLHEVFLKDASTIMARITDYGRANLRNKTDNIPSLQIWKKVNIDHPRFSEIKHILEQKHNR